jgi:O-antigen/teichoic acid export membrane protein
MSPKASESSTIWRHGRVYLLGNFLNRLAGLFLIPVYTKFLSPEEFGVYALIVVVTDLIAGALGLGVGNALARVYLGYAKEQDRRRVISTTLLAFCAIGVVFLLMSWPFANAVGHRLFGDDAHTTPILLALAGLVFATLSTVQLDYYRVRKESGTFLWLSLAKSALMLVLNIAFVIGLGLGVSGIFLGTLLAFAPLSLVLLLVILRQAGLGFSLPMLRELLRLGSPIVPAVLFDAAGTFIERYLLNLYMSTAHVGFYALGARLAQLIRMFVTQPFNQIYVVRRFETFGDAETQVQLSEVFLYFMILITSAGLGLSLMAPEIITVISTPAYMPAAQVIPFLALGICFNAIWMSHWEVGVVQVKRTGVVPLVSAACLLIGAGLAAVLIRRFGLVGAGIAMMAMHLSRMILMAIISKRLCPDQPPLETLRIATTIALAIAVYTFSALMFNNDVNVGTAALKMLLLLAFAVIVFFSPIVGPAGRSLALTSLRGSRACVPVRVP